MSLLAANNMLVASANVILNAGDELARYEFEEGVGTSSANLGSNLDPASLAGSVSWVGGLYGNSAVEIDVASTSNYVDLKYENIDPQGDFSFCFLLKTPAVFEEFFGLIGVGGDTVTNNNYLAFYMRASGLLRVLFRNNVEVTGAINGVTIMSPSTVYACGITVSVTDGMKIYLDGRLEAHSLGSRLGNITNVSELRLGVITRQSPIIGKGTWDSVRIFDRAIAQQEMQFYSSLRN